MMSKEHQIVAQAVRELRAELGRVPSLAVQDSVRIYLQMLQDRLVDLFEEDDRQFDRSTFERSCAEPDHQSSKAA